MLEEAKLDMHRSCVPKRQGDIGDTLRSLRLKAAEFSTFATEEKDPLVASELRNLAASYARQAALIEAGSRGLEPDPEPATLQGPGELQP
jgi:hypothetical protein